MDDKSEIKKLREELAQLRTAIAAVREVATAAKKIGLMAQDAADTAQKQIPAGGLDGQFLTLDSNLNLCWRDVGKTGLPFADSN